MSEQPAVAEDDFIGLTTDIVAAYVSHNPVAAVDLARFIADTHAALRGLGSLSPFWLRAPPLTIS